MDSDLTARGQESMVMVDRVQVQDQAGLVASWPVDRVQVAAHPVALSVTAPRLHPGQVPAGSRLPGSRLASGGHHGASCALVVCAATATPAPCSAQVAAVASDRSAAASAQDA